MHDGLMKHIRASEKSTQWDTNGKTTNVLWSCIHRERAAPFAITVASWPDDWYYSVYRSQSQILKMVFMFPCLFLLVFVVARRCTVYESDRIGAGGAVHATKYGREKKWFIAHQRCTANEWKGPIRERRTGRKGGVHRMCNIFSRTQQQFCCCFQHSSVHIQRFCKWQSTIPLFIYTYHTDIISIDSNPSHAFLIFCFSCCADLCECVYGKWGEPCKRARERRNGMQFYSIFFFSTWCELHDAMWSSSFLVAPFLYLFRCKHSPNTTRHVGRIRDTSGAESGKNVWTTECLCDVAVSWKEYHSNNNKFSHANTGRFARQAYVFFLSTVSNHANRMRVERAWNIYLWEYFDWAYGIGQCNELLCSKSEIEYHLNGRSGEMRASHEVKIHCSWDTNRQ